MSLIGNERTKLVANALDRASTACFAVGVLAPIATSMYDRSGGQPIYREALFYFGSFFGFSPQLSCMCWPKAS